MGDTQTTMAAPEKRPAEDDLAKSVTKKARTEDLAVVGTVPGPQGSTLAKSGEGSSTAKPESKSLDVMRETFNYPVFTDEFLFFNRKRDEEVKELQKKKNGLESSNTKLKKQVKELDEVVGTITKEVTDLSGQNKQYKNEFEALITAIVSLTGAEAPADKVLTADTMAPTAQVLKDLIFKMDVSAPTVRQSLKEIGDRLRQTISNTIDEAS